MAAVHGVTVTLRFHGDDLDPQELSHQLGANPTTAAVKGGTYLTENGSERVAKTGFWLLRIQPAEAEDLDHQLGQLFAAMTPNEETWHDVCQRFRGNLFVGLFLGSSNEGLIIAPQIATAIGARGLELGFDIYAPTTD